VIEFAETLNMYNNTRVLALDSYTELLDLLNFMYLPGIQQRRAEIRMILVTILIISYVESLRSLSILSLVMFLLKYLAIRL